MTIEAFESASELAARIKDKELSSLELTDYYIERIEKYDGDINAVVVRDFERAREAAKTADTLLAKGTYLGLLHGVPMTIKEAYDVEGLPTTWGIPEYRNNIATADSDTVLRMKSAGAHFLGKTNVPFNLADFQTYNDVYGTTNNPWDLSRIPGGSSGGSAAALAAGLTALEAGSDIGGSIRNPAHFCGVYGHKPTWGVVSDVGHGFPGQLAAPMDIAVVGPLARSAEDLALSLDIASGPGRTDVAGWQLNLPRHPGLQLGHLRVALWPNDERAPVSAQIEARVRSVGTILAGLGAKVSESARPAINLDNCYDVYFSLMQGVMSAGMAKKELAAHRALAKSLAPEDRSIAAMVARYTSQDHSVWAFNNDLRFQIRKTWQAFFRDWDILICPQAPITAFPHDHSDKLERSLTVDGKPQDYFQQIFWAGLATLAHLPSTVFPTGCTNDGLPVGLQAIGAEYQDYLTIEFARSIAGEIGGFVPPPSFQLDVEA